VSVLFLDIDGVLNDHTYDERAESTTILRPWGGGPHTGGGAAPGGGGL
jgi:hypothetical protein